MIKVVELVDALYDGGAENIAREYATTLDKDKFSSIIVTILDARTTANYKRAIDASVKICSIYNNCGILSKGMRRLLGMYTIPKRLKRILKDEKPNVIHIHSPLLRYLVPISKHLKGVTLFYTCHSNPSSFFSGKNAVEKLAAEKLIKNNGLCLIALHEQMRVELNKMFGVDNTIVIKNGVNFEYFKPNYDSRLRLRKELNIPEDAFVIGHIGRFAMVKNHTFLIDIFNEISKKKKKSYMILVGNGPLEIEIRNKIKELGMVDKVRILSHRTDTAELLNAMDVFVFPSLYEGLPVTLVEAQATGLKCVVSDRINYESILTPKTIPMDIEESATKWADVILDDNIINYNHGNLNLFDIGREIKKLESIYEKRNG